MLELKLLVVGRHLSLLVGVLRLSQIGLALLHARLGHLNLPRSARQTVLQIGVLPVNAVQRAQCFSQRGHQLIIRKMPPRKRPAAQKRCSSARRAYSKPPAAPITSSTTCLRTSRKPPNPPASSRACRGE